MRQRKASLAAASLAAGLAIFATACSGGDGGTKDTANGSGAGGGSDASGKGKEADAAYKHRQCLRDHGVKVEEPKPGQDPRGMVIGAGGNVDQEKMKKALEACKSTSPNAGKSELTQADKDEALKYARCMRKNGFNMPDPKFEGGGMMGKAMTMPQGEEKKKFEKANKACGGQNAG
ncbi:hypothetical protein [Streptomyces celluloflavus]|uniref:hypothetical protein n=1 Tax=Streptomyces celluloflavus TaxID=58344 RepID=UPI00365E7672